MKSNYVLKTFAIFCFSATLVYIGFFVINFLEKEKVKVTIEIYDDTSSKIIEVKLNNKPLPLKSSPIFLKLHPKKYDLIWKFQKNNNLIEKQEQIDVKPNQPIEMKIKGENIIIN
jgi:hypothetical protein